MIYEAAIFEEMPLPEADLFARMRRGDPAAFAPVVARYRYRLYRYLLRLTRDRAAADDLFQQTWLQVVRHIARYDPRKNFDAWLFSIAHNAAMDFVRRRREESLDEAFDPPQIAPNPLDRLLAAERAARVAGGLASLPAAHREVLTLRFEEDMKLEEIAEVVGAPLPTVKSRLRRGLERLRERLRS
jgi:RNA polymerase sigma-70 factor, ECF subfamily